MNFHSFNSFAEDGFAWAWKTSLQASVLIALVWLLQLVFKRALAPRWRYTLGLLIVLRLMLPGLPASSFSVFNFTPRAVSSPQIISTSGLIEQAPVSEAVSPETPLTFVISPDVAHFSIPGFIWLTGCALMLIMAIRQQRRLHCQLQKQRPIDEPRIIQLLEECKIFLGIERRVTVYATLTLNTPALFGHWRPRLLVPEAMLQRLDERELRLIFLHELTHLRRRDILVNWLIIFARSLHWFNPLVWLALKRLRADQELACDAAVMALLVADERKLYGNTLIKLLAEFSASPLCPGLVPFVTNKQLIKRRIAMIAKFKPGGRIALLGSLALIAALGCFTFTRAAEKPAPVNVPPGVAAVESDAKAKLDIEIRTLDILRAKLDQMTKQLHERQEQLNLLQNNLNISSEIAEGKTASTVDAEKLRHYQSLAVESESEYVRQEALLRRLKELSLKELRDVIPTAAPDTLLASLLEQLSQGETKLAGLHGSVGDNNPEVQQARAVVESLDKKVNDRVKGIMTAMNMKLDALKDVLENSKEKMEKARREDIVSQERTQPYFEVKRELEALQKSRDALSARLTQEGIDFSLMQTNKK